MQRLAPGRWLNSQLRLLSWLGEELHGDSFLAEQRPQGRHVLIKIFHAEACRTPAYLERFRQQAERAMALRHRHMAAVHAFGVLPGQPEAAPAASGRPPFPQKPGVTPTPPGIPWIATDPVEGPDLRSHLLDGMAPVALAELLLPIADLLDRAAALELAHGELSPASLIIVSDDVAASPRAVLLDLGLAKLQGDDPLEVPLPPGLWCYRSPEQCTQGSPGRAPAWDPACDRYALAAILFESVAGRPPFLSMDPRELLRAHRQAPVPPLRTLVPNLHRAQALDAFFVRALAKQPEARFPSATATVEEFLIALGGRGLEDRRLPQRRRSARWYRLRRAPDKVLDVVIGPRAVLGKQPECDVVCHGLPSPQQDAITAGISREHAVLIWLDDRLSVLDQSCNGTYVNDRRAGPRLTPVPDGALLRMGEHLTLQVRLLHSSESDDAEEVIGAYLERQDPYAAGVPPTLMLWHRVALGESPLAQLAGAFAAGHLWIAQRELFFSGHPALNWQRQDHTPVLGPAPLRDGDVLEDAEGVVQVEH